LLGVALILSAASSGGQDGVKLRKIGKFDHPTYVAGAPGFPRLLFVVEQTGRVIAVGQGRRNVFLDIKGLVDYTAGVHGLFSIAFPPDYRQSGFFYVFYTEEGGDFVIDAFRRRTARRAARGSRRTILDIHSPDFSQHSGGQLQFHGRLLYASIGDGGYEEAGDLPNNAQRLDRLLGKIDPRARRGYKVPRDNPFVGRPGRDAIFSYGLRNPWRFSFDRNRILIADVGERRFEEIDYETIAGARGANFGWDAFEGFSPYNCGALCPNGSPDPGGTQKPIFTYSRGGGGCTVIGGYVVRDPRLPSLRGRYLYSDLCVGKIRSLIPHLSGATRDRSLGLTVPGPTSFGEDTRGRVYVASQNGPVYRLVPR
jgi:glucose/arabinose dehydrogenase